MKHSTSAPVPGDQECRLDVVVRTPDRINFKQMLGV
jgi:hypothetical protein